MQTAAASEPPCWVVHCDGSALPNPGRMGLGAVLVGPDGRRLVLSEAAAGRGCNNEAELRAVMAALHRLRQQGARAARIYSDNSVLVTQLNGLGDAAPVVRLAALFGEARGLMAGFDCASVNWVPRHRNAEADALARAALGLAPKPARKPGSRVRRR